MTRYLPLLLASLLLVGCQTGRVRTVTILHTNDFHGRYTAFEASSRELAPGQPPGSPARSGLIGGFDRLAAAVKDVRHDRGRGNVLLLHGGDTFSDDLLGNLTEGRAMIELMNALGYDMAALGNHDFDYGRFRTETLAQLADFPIRAANVIDTRTAEPFLGTPWKLFRVAGLDVGVLAIGYRNTALTTSRNNIAGLQFLGYEAASEYVLELRPRVDLLVALSHLGSAVDEQLARKIPGIDVIVGAHSHDYLSPARKVNATWLVQAGSDCTALGELTIAVGPGGIEDIRHQLHLLWADEREPDERMSRRIAALRAPYREHLTNIIGQADGAIARRYKSESPFDKLVGRVLRLYTNSQVAMLPGVGYGIAIEPGPLPRERLYTLLPHPSRIATVELPGRAIVAILEQSAYNLAPPDPNELVGGLIQTDGMQWKIDLNRPLGHRISNVRIAGEPIQPDRDYTVATHTGMLEGMHRYQGFAHGRAMRKLDTRVNQFVEEYFRRNSPLRAPPLGDIELILPD